MVGIGVPRFEALLASSIIIHSRLIILLLLPFLHVVWWCLLVVLNVLDMPIFWSYSVNQCQLKKQQLGGVGDVCGTQGRGRSTTVARGLGDGKDGIVLLG